MPSETKYFVDLKGNYIGGFEGASALSLVPKDAIEVPDAPGHAMQKWNFNTQEYDPIA